MPLRCGRHKIESKLKDLSDPFLSLTSLSVISTLSYQIKAKTQEKERKASLIYRSFSSHKYIYIYLFF